MSPVELIKFLSVIEKLKCNLRHSWTSSGRHESVAEHSWRTAVMAMLLKDEIKDIDHDKVIKMCLIHDFGEVITGDIPSFDKSQKDIDAENKAVIKIISTIEDEAMRDELIGLYDEIYNLSSKEARAMNAIDKLEAVISHNEADINTWLPLEFELNAKYGKDECDEFIYLKQLRDCLKNNTQKKIDNISNVLE